MSQKDPLLDPTLLAAAFAHDVAHTLRRLEQHLVRLAEAHRIPEGDPSFEGARRSLQQAIELSEQPLMARTLSRGELRLERQVLAVREMVTNVLALFEPQVRALALQVSLQCSAEMVAEVDEAQFSRALTNVLDNAIRHSPNGGTLRIEVQHEHGALVLAVEDQGPGMPAQVLQGAGAPLPSSHGSGLGLFIASKVLELHGGSLRLENLTPTGARVTLMVPLRAEQ